MSKISAELVPRVLASTDPSTSNTPLLWACLTGFLPCVSLLVEGGSNLKVQNQDGKTAMHLAVAAGAVDSVGFLLEKMWDLVNVSDADGATPLHYASVSFPQMVSLFKAAQASFRVYDHDGDTPLHWAVRDSCVDNVREMAEYDSELKSILNAEGESPLYLSELYCEKEILQILVGHQPEMMSVEMQEATTTTTKSLEFNMMMNPKMATTTPQMMKGPLPGSNVWGLDYSHVGF